MPEMVLYINSQVTEQLADSQIKLFLLEELSRLLLTYQGWAGWTGYTTFQRHFYAQLLNGEVKCADEHVRRERSPAGTQPAFPRGLLQLLCFKEPMDSLQR